MSKQERKFGLRIKILRILNNVGTKITSGKIMSRMTQLEWVFNEDSFRVVLSRMVQEGHIKQEHKWCCPHCENKSRVYKITDDGIRYLRGKR